MTRRLLHLLTAATLLPAFTGCFTGIESTPAITDNDLRRQNIRSTPEDSYLDDIEHAVSAADNLSAGKRFFVTDPKIRLVLDPSASSADIRAGDTLRLSDISEATSVDGRKVADIRLADRTGAVFAYRTALSPDDLLRARRADIPFTVDLDLVEAVRGKMAGQTYFITTSTRYDLNDQIFNGRRFVPVTIDAVEPGSAYYPIRLTLTDDRGAKFRLYMSVGSTISMPRKFASMFSLTDPHTRHPAITDANWALIIEGRVAQGMTRDECRLAMGTPANIDRQTGYSVLREIWTYDGGRFLVFDDGILETFRL